MFNLVDFTINLASTIGGQECGPNEIDIIFNQFCESVAEVESNEKFI